MPKAPIAITTTTEARERTCIIAVNCIHPGGTCFCHSMKSGPRAHEGFDLALTEVRDDADHYFIVERGTPARVMRSWLMFPTA